MENDTNIWVYELARGTSVRLTDQPASDEKPLWTRDGRRVIYNREVNIYWTDADGRGEEELLHSTGYDLVPLDVSPDGKRLLFAESRQPPEGAILALPLDGEGEATLIVRSGGDARLFPDGTELCFIDDRMLMAATVHLGAAVEIGKPRVLFESSCDDYWLWPNDDDAADGRFLMVKTPAERAPRQVNVVLNWFEELERFVPTP